MNAFSNPTLISWMTLGKRENKNHTKYNNINIKNLIKIRNGIKLYFKLNLFQLRPN